MVFLAAQQPNHQGARVQRDCLLSDVKSLWGNGVWQVVGVKWKTPACWLDTDHLQRWSALGRGVGRQHCTYQLMRPVAGPDG